MNCSLAFFLLFISRMAFGLFLKIYLSIYLTFYLVFYLYSIYPSVVLSFYHLFWLRASHFSLCFNELNSCLLLYANPSPAAHLNMEITLENSNSQKAQSCGEGYSQRQVMFRSSFSLQHIVPTAILKLPSSHWHVSACRCHSQMLQGKSNANFSNLSVSLPNQSHHSKSLVFHLWKLL